MSVISLLTDFGSKDGYVGVMKGVIWGIHPQVSIADLSHDISPQNILEAALLLGRVWRFFPAGSVHLAVIDPGVGTRRHAIAGSVGGQFFVAPDNGLLEVVLQQAEQLDLAQEWVCLDQTRFWLTTISNVFHGRDIFAPVAAHLSRGVTLQELGSPLPEITRLKLPVARPTPRGWSGQVIHVDHFGNLSTNIRGQDLDGCEGLSVVVGGLRISHVVKAFGEGKPGDIVVLIDSAGMLSVSMVNGSAAHHLGLGQGAPVEVFCD